MTAGVIYNRWSFRTFYFEISEPLLSCSCLIWTRFGSAANPVLTVLTSNLSKQFTLLFQAEFK